MEQKLVELDQRVFALEQAAPKVTPPGESKGFLDNLNPIGQGVNATSPPDDSKGFLDKFNPFGKGGSRRKSRRSKSKKSRKSRR